MTLQPKKRKKNSFLSGTICRNICVCMCVVDFFCISQFDAIPFESILFCQGMNYPSENIFHTHGKSIRFLSCSFGLIPDLNRFLTKQNNQHTFLNNNNKKRTNRIIVQFIEKEKELIEFHCIFLQRYYSNNIYSDVSLLTISFFKKMYRAKFHSRLRIRLKNHEHSKMYNSSSFSIFSLYFFFLF